MYITSHALQRYQLHHPRATRLDLWSALQGSEELSPELVAALCGRREPDRTSRYFAHENRLGIFVVSVRDSTVITYLRLESSQREILLPREASASDLPAPLSTVESKAEKRAKKLQALMEARRDKELQDRYAPLLLMDPADSC